MEYYPPNYNLEKLTMDRMFAAIFKAHAERPALGFVNQPMLTYAQIQNRVLDLQQTLRQVGIKKEDKIVILGGNSPNWGIAFIAIMTMGAVAVPIMAEFPEPDVEYTINHSEASAIFIDEGLYNSLNLPSMEKMRVVFNLNDFSLLTDAADEKKWALPEKLKNPFEKPDAANGETESFLPEIEEDDLAQILYTSGTTGHSKGVMLTHKNLVSNTIAGPEVVKAIHSGTVVLGILPLAHAFGSTNAFLSVLYCGGSIAYLDKKPSPKILLKAMQDVQPTLLGAVPLIFEKIHQKQVVPKIAGNWALRNMVKVPALRKAVHKIVGRKVKEAFGGKLESTIIGGASLAPDLELFLREAGIPYVCGYGMSECSPLITGSSLTDTKFGSVGYPVTDVSVKIVDPDPETGVGEIYVKGPNVMKGYYKNEAETRRVFTDDGWLITGDRGYFDDDGYLFIKGRSKNVIIGPSGENIYPEIIEDLLKGSPFVDEALVYELENQVTARIYPDYTYIQSQEKNKDDSAIGEDIEQILEDVRRQVNAALPSFSKIQKVIEQRSPFIKTPSNKIKRAEYVPNYGKDRT